MATTITATRDDIRPTCDPQHLAERDRVAAIVAHVQAHGWDLPPVLVLEDEGNGYGVLDGHHRLAAARHLARPTIPAYIVTIADYCRLLDAEFDGAAPPRLADLDDYILIEGRPYVRPSGCDDDEGVR